ncbi:S41 family peptidase [Filimonas effusa]|uniref:PDZ domain-containing protein n=1 Tax=Filimonas effusa TaxID=2508721 RepID=A0A4Q1D4S0_9BACT|nr:S41 family peptidase [Filimonas effusa]RXK83338.1 hypothetical protein ESB13_14640 [Filimonas effusa]
MISYYSARLYTILVLIIAFGSCKKEQQQLLLPAEQQWILDSMRTYYYWNDQLPSQPAAAGSASDFFASLLYSKDRFSFVTDPGAEKKEYSSFAWYGFEYALLTGMSTPDKLTGVITLVVPGGPAARQGLKRGDYFTAVNGIALTASSKPVAEQLLRSGDGVRLTTAAFSGGILQEGVTLPVSYSYYSEQPVYTSKVLSAGDRKVGYLFYNQFNGYYDQVLLNTLAGLKQQGIQELILDLRYNPGGDVSSSAKLAAALCNASADQPFVIYQANRNGGRRTSSFQTTIRENNYMPLSFSEIAGYRVSLSRVFILTGGGTASASELLVNSLRPYMRVIQIGGRTMGKDMASFAINDRSIPRKTDLVLHPLVFKLYNANGQGDYANGLTPDELVDEWSVLPLLPFGDVQDPLINRALALISASPTGKRLANAADLTTAGTPRPIRWRNRNFPDGTYDITPATNGVLYLVSEQTTRPALPVEVSGDRFR